MVKLLNSKEVVGVLEMRFTKYETKKGFEGWDFGLRRS